MSGARKQSLNGSSLSGAASPPLSDVNPAFLEERIATLEIELEGERVAKDTLQELYNELHQSYLNARTQIKAQERQIKTLLVRQTPSVPVDTAANLQPLTEG